MTINTSADTFSTPPSVDVTVSVAGGSVMSSVAIYRNDSSGRTLLRTQPAAGFDSRTVTDYECPYGESITYDWIAAYSSVGSALFTETWASTAAWTISEGSWNVSGGTLRNTGTGDNTIFRAVATARYRTVIASMTEAISSATFMRFQIEDGSSYVRLDLASDGSIQLGYVGGIVPTTLDGTQPITIDVNETSVSVTGTGGSYNLPVAMQVSLYVVRTSGVALNGFRLGGVTVSSYGSTSTIQETSGPFFLTPTAAWLIHPGTPGLSLPLSNTDQSAAGIAAIAPVANDTNATVHKILGTATPVPTTTGPRGDDETAMTIWTATTAERGALRALLASDIPILIQIPPEWDTDFTCGFYAVGNLNETRDSDQVRFPNATRTFVLPLVKVQSPVVDVENTGWSYAAVAAEFATYSLLSVTFGTYADLASNSRS